MNQAAHQIGDQAFHGSSGDQIHDFSGANTQGLALEEKIHAEDLMSLQCTMLRNDQC